MSCKGSEPTRGLRHRILCVQDTQTDLVPRGQGPRCQTITAHRTIHGPVCRPPLAAHLGRNDGLKVEESLVVSVLSECPRA